MSTMDYTRELSISMSSAVDDAFYNDNDQTLYLDLHDNMYAYKNVPADVVEQFEKAPSAGKFYVENIKRTYGPAEDLGHWTDVDYNEVDVDTGVSAAMPKNLTYANNAVVDGNAINAVDTVNEYFSMTVPAAAVAAAVEVDWEAVAESYNEEFLGGVKTAQYKVEFILDGLVRKTVIYASSFGHAVTEVQDAANVFGLKADVRSVSLV